MRRRGLFARVAVAAAALALFACAPDAPPVSGARSGNGLVYDVVGQGPEVVLIHGSNLDRRLWDDDLPWLQAQARVLRYDQRGAGASDHPEEPYANHADLLALLDELGIESATLVGLSAGAQLAVDVALEAPERVRGLVLVSPSLVGFLPDPVPPFFADLAAALGTGDYQGANAVLLASPIMAVPPAVAGRVRAMVEDNSRMWTIPWDLLRLPEPLALERLEAVAVPTLVLVGADDVAAVRAVGELIAERMPAARLRVIDGGGHLLNLTSPAAFRAAIDAFLRQLRD